MLKNVGTKMERISEKIFYSVLAFGFCAGGLMALFDPFVYSRPYSSGGYTASGTIVRLAGWIALNMGWAVLSIIYPGLKSMFFKGTPQWQFFLKGLFFIGFVSGIIGFMTGKVYGILRVEGIREPIMRIAEGGCALLSIAGLLFYRNIESFFRDIFSESDRDDNSNNINT